MSIKEQPPQQLPNVSDDHSTEQGLHLPVLLDQTLRLLNPSVGESYLDLTAGYGGHASRFLEVTGNYQNSVLVDRDDFAISHLRSLETKGARLIHTDFVSAAQQLIEEGKKFDILIVDLGVSSPQLDKSERGFSFKNSGPLDMRMDRRQELSAETLVNTATKHELTAIIQDYGEEPFGIASRIAEAVIDARPLKTTGELAQLIEQMIRSKRSKIHPATRTFQAIRIAVNQELRQVELLLPLLPRLLNSGGKAGIISFHSLEDRLVKRYLVDQDRAGLEAELVVKTKRPLDGKTYDVHNPRARSAKLRVAVKK